MTDNIYQHIDIREEDKENAFSLGKKLIINHEEFEVSAVFLCPKGKKLSPIFNFSMDNFICLVILISCSSKSNA